jgi:outer membrane protein OmpA-like peptidoglycan-associated protein
MKISTSHLAVTAAVAMALAACSSAPPRIDDVESARSAVQRIESSPDAGKYAAAEVSAAHQALRDADELVAKKKPRKDVQAAAYVAQRHADIAAERIQAGQAEEKTKAAEEQRQKVVLQAREQEAAAARAQAEAATQQAQAARQDAESQRQRAQMTAESAQREAAELAAQLRDLQAKQTDRGLVLTLGDVLFDTGKATLKPGADSTMDRLSSFLEKSPDRSVTIEGHTDSTGSDDFNQTLSENRANAVKASLVGKGVPAQRIVAVGKGEGVPVASNDNPGGRQQNRRVEIIISNPTEVASKN